MFSSASLSGPHTPPRSHSGIAYPLTPNTPSTQEDAPPEPPIWKTRGWKPRNLWERALLNSIPEYALSNELFTTDEQLDAWHKMLGHDPSDFARLRKQHDDGWNKKMENSGGKVPVLGKKPEKGEPAHFVDVPGSEGISIRMWDAGLIAHGLFGLDFVYTTTEKAVNSPKGWKIYPVSGPTTPCWGDRLVSWEEALNRGEVAQGQERFSVPQGAFCCLTRNGQEDFWFQVPERPNVCPLPQVVVARPSTRRSK